MKRVVDVVLVVLSLPLVVPVVLASMVAVRLSTPGPALFRQTRVGRHEKPFVCYKLRTMYEHTAHAPSHEISSSFVTPVGARLRRLKLDELPQVWNILRGDMSLVGPRPCLPSQSELIAARHARGLYAVRPGITGVAQVAGIDMSQPERLAEVDATYLQDMSLATDLRLIVATLSGAGLGDRTRP